MLYLFNDLLGLEDGVGVGHELLSLDGLLQLIQLAGLLPLQAFLFPRLNRDQETGIKRCNFVRKNTITYSGNRTGLLGYVPML